MFIAQFHLQDPDPDPEYGSGFRIQPGDLNPDPPGSATLAVPQVFRSLWTKFLKNSRNVDYK